MNSIRKYFIPGLLVLCTLLLAFWQVMSWVSQRPYESFALTPEKMATCQPALEGWVVRALPITRDALIDANIAAYSIVRNDSSNNQQPITNNHYLTRLVHGYNMPMCMKMKYYTVEKIQDYKVRPVSDPKLQSAFRLFSSSTKQLTNSSEIIWTSSQVDRDLRARSDAARRSASTSGCLDYHENASNSLTTILPSELPFQLWRVTSSAGTVTIWVTTMIRADNFSPTTEDICSMAFPRVDIPDEPNWVPRGLGLDDLKHPVFSFKRWARGRWDAARWDVMTFLRLRQPVRTSEELLSYVSRTDSLPDNVVRSQDIQTLLQLHIMMLKELQRWRNSGESAAK